MPDAFLEWNGDFKVSASGGLRMVDGDELTRQRLMRRLCTAVQGYIWHKDYGAGLPQKIGSVYSPSAIEAVVRKQVNFEATVAPSPPPRVKVSSARDELGLIPIDISYTDAVTGEAVSFKIAV
jgi:hypothetical protein